MGKNRNEFHNYRVVARYNGQSNVTIFEMKGAVPYGEPFDDNEEEEDDDY